MISNVTRRSLFTGALTLGVSALALAGGASAQSRTLQLSHHLAPGHLVDIASQRFAELVAEGTGGEIMVEVFPSGQLAGLRQAAEAVQVGTIDVVWTDFGTLANFRPEYGFVSLPFLFQDNEHVEAVFGGPVGDELRQSVRDSLGIEILGYGNAGFRVIATKDRPVTTPADLEGARIRVPEVPIFVSSFGVIGANPTPMAWGEVYTALQTGVIDAVENPAEGLFVGGMHEVTTNLSRTYHIMTDVNLAISAMVLDSLTPEHQEVIRSAGETATAEFNTATAEASEDFWNRLAETLEVVDEPDREAFREAMAPVWDEFIAANGEAGQGWIDKVIAAGGQ
jgi:tripartite ATP-independent transporter DctP family solute receptor